MVSQKSKREAGKSPLLSRPPLSTGQLALRLGLAFSLLIGVLIAVGDLDLRRMNRINAEMQDLTGKQWTTLRLSREALTYSNRNSRITTQIFLTEDRERINSLVAARTENTSRIVALIAELEKLCQSDGEKQLLVVIEEKRALYIDSYARALHLLVDEGKRDAAIAVMSEESTPALLQYQAAWDDFVRSQGDQFELAAGQSQVHFGAARRLALFTILAAIVATGMIAFFVTTRTLREITARLHTEKEELRTAHHDAEVFINAVPSILIGVDHDTRVTRWNAAAAAVFGLAEEEVIGKPLATCGVNWLRRGIETEIDSWGSEQISRRCDQISFEVQGETHLLGLTINPVQMSEKNLTKTLVIGSDVTERNALEDQLRQAQKLESVGQLASGIAHEINTPTQYIGDNVRFLKDAFQSLEVVRTSYERLLAAASNNTLSPETVREVTDALETAEAAYLFEEIPKAIDQTLEGVSRVAKLVSAMKEFSHPGTKEKIPLDLNHAIENTVTVARNEWKYVADMETEFDPALPRVSCLPGEFNQVILNLIVNAAHAIADVIARGGAEKGKIKIQTRDSADWVEIRIEDTGSGIPEKVRARIFDPFFTTKEIGKGTGQGLAIARSVVVDKHGGTIHFETEEGTGTTFIVRLPHDSNALAKGVSA
jgi:PAS domain S-box-containing protein